MKPTLIIVGLGNPGAAYASTRHNAGFRALNALHAAFGGGEWKERAKVQSVVSEIAIGDVPVLLAKPTTFMNRSGEAVSKLVNFYKAIKAFTYISGHSRSNPVTKIPGCLVRHVQRALHLIGRNTLLGFHHQVSSYEPLREREVAVMEYGPGSNGELVAA